MQSTCELDEDCSQYPAGVAILMNVGIVVRHQAALDSRNIQTTCQIGFDTRFDHQFVILFTIFDDLPDNGGPD